MDDHTTWDDLCSASNSSDGIISKLARAFRGATLISIELDGVIVERGGRRASQKVSGKFSAEQVAAAEQTSRKEGAHNGRPILQR